MPTVHDQEYTYMEIFNRDLVKRVIIKSLKSNPQCSKVKDNIKEGIEEFGKVLEKFSTNAVPIISREVNITYNLAKDLKEGSRITKFTRCTAREFPREPALLRRPGLSKSSARQYITAMS